MYSLFYSHLSYSIHIFSVVLVSRLVRLLLDPPSNILLSTSIASFSCRYPIPLYVILRSYSIRSWSIKVLASVVKIFIIPSASIKVIKHQVHVFPLLPL